MTDEGQRLLRTILTFGVEVMMPTLLRMEAKLEELAAQVRAVQADQQIILAALRGAVSDNAIKSANPPIGGVEKPRVPIPISRKDGNESPFA